MRRLLSSAGKKLAVLVLVLLVLAAVLWWQRTPVLSWYYLRGLAAAGEGERSVWIERVASLDADAVPGLLGHLRREDVKVCANAEAALASLVQRWGPNDPRTAAAAEDMAGAFSALSVPGREAALEWYLALLRQVDPENKGMRSVTSTAGKMLALAARMHEKGIRLRTLALAEVILARLHPDKADLQRDLALEGVSSPDVEIRARAVRLAMHAPLHDDTGLVNMVITLLKDKAPEVRRAALLTVGLSKKHMTVDDLLPLLQDSDAEVRRLCEDALKSRDLTAFHIKLARLITDPRPGERLRVVHHLQQADDLDPGVWLLRLSQDPSPAVRAAAIRFVAEDPSAADFQERLEQMAQTDPSPTVQQLAQYYLKTLAQSR